MRPHQIGGDDAGAVFAHHAAEQELPGVRCAHPARLFGAVERERIGAEFVTPERFFKTLGEPLRLGPKLVRPVAHPEARRATRRQLFAGKYIALHFSECDVTLGQASVGVKDRVVRILPALIGQALFRRAPEQGLANQGWKDSYDAIFHADGRLAEGYIALAEVQGYVFAGKQLAARCASRLGMSDRAHKLRAEAQRLAERFEEAFWCDELGTYEIG